MKTTRDPVRLDSLPVHGETLSPAGRARCDAMLASLESAVRSRGHRRRAALGLAAVSPALAIAGALLTLRPFATPAPPPPIAVADPGAVAPSPPPEIGSGAESPAPALPSRAPVRRLVGYVTNDSGASARYSVTSEPLRVQIIDDEALLDALRDAGMPAGMVRTQERIALAFHPGLTENATQ